MLWLIVNEIVKKTTSINKKNNGYDLIIIIICTKNCWYRKIVRSAFITT